MPKIDLQAIRNRAEAATPGPWTWVDGEQLCYRDSGPCPRGLKYEGDESCCGCPHLDYSVPAMVDGPYVVVTPDWDGLNDENATFIAHAREDIPALLDAIENQEKMIDDLAEKVRCYTELEKYAQGLENQIRDLRVQLAARAAAVEWHTYDGTPETLPPISRTILVSPKAFPGQKYVRATYRDCGKTGQYSYPMNTDSWYYFMPGDRWAYLPTPPEVEREEDVR